MAKCKKCNGTGKVSIPLNPKEKVVCPACHGSGEVKYVENILESDPVKRK